MERVVLLMASRVSGAVIAHMWTGCLLTAVGAMRPDSRMRSMVSLSMGRGEKERQE